MALSQLPAQPLPVVCIFRSQAAYLFWLHEHKYYLFDDCLLGIEENVAPEVCTLSLRERTVPTTTSVTKLSLNSTLSFPSSESLPCCPDPTPTRVPPRTPKEAAGGQARQGESQSLACANAVSCLFAFSEPQRRMPCSSHGQPEGSC